MQVGDLQAFLDALGVQALVGGLLLVIEVALIVELVFGDHALALVAVVVVHALAHLFHAFGGVCHQGKGLLVRGLVLIKLLPEVLLGFLLVLLQLEDNFLNKLDLFLDGGDRVLADVARLGRPAGIYLIKMVAFCHFVASFNPGVGDKPLLRREDIDGVRLGDDFPADVNPPGIAGEGHQAYQNN